MDPNTGIDTSGNADGSLQSQPQAPYRFNNEELRVLRQCNKESFYQRSLPLSTVFSIGTYYAVRTGYLRTHPKFGSVPKVLIAATVGYFIGKFSYQSKCAEKLMQLPNSPIGEMLRQRRRQAGPQEIRIIDQSTFSWPETDLTGSASQMPDIDLPMENGLDTYRPLDTPTFEEDSIITVPAHTTSYEELRRKNREEFENQKPKPIRTPAQEEIRVPSVSSPLSSDSVSMQRSAKNKYGDVWSE